jgi:hypothetical protein
MAYQEKHVTAVELMERVCFLSQAMRSVLDACFEVLVLCRSSPGFDCHCGEGSVLHSMIHNLQDEKKLRCARIHVF